MKKLLFIHLFWFCCLVYSQNNGDKVYEVNYDHYFDIDEDKFYQFYSNNSNRDVVERNKYTFTKIDNYVLICNSKESVFSKLDKLNNTQHIKDEIKSNGDEISFFSKGGLKLYKNLNENFTLIPEKGKVMIQDSLYHFVWDLNYTEEKEILGITTKKATTIGLEPDTTVTVWYAKDIPYENGPDIYGGVPGLILQVDVSVNSKEGIALYINSYHYKATSIKEIKQTKEFKKVTGNNKILTKDEFEEKKAELKKKQDEYNSYGVDTD